MKKRILLLVIVVISVISLSSCFSSCFDGIIPDVISYSYFDGENEYHLEKTIGSPTGNRLNVGQREGYEFLGYYTDDGIQYFDKDGEQVDGIIIDKSMVLFPKYQPYTLSFEFRGTDATIDTTSMKLQYGQTILSLPNAIPNDESLELDGWFSKNGDIRYSNGVVPVNNIANFESYSFLDNSLTMYAKFKTKTFTVTVDFCDNEHPNKQYTVKYGESVGDLSKYYLDTGIRDICEWTAVGGNEIPDRVYENITIYAVWKEYTYVTFVYGENDERELKVHIKPGENSVLPTEGMPGYKLLGWYENTAFSGNPIHTVMYGALADKYYGKFEATNYKLSFVVEDGDKPNDIIYNYGERVSLPRLTKDGYTFAGWTIGKRSSLAYNKIYEYMWGDMILYPKWVKSNNTATVRLVCDQYYMEDDFIFEVGEYLELPNVKVDGYHFAGWYDSNNIEYDSTIQVENAISMAVLQLYAKVHESTPISSAEDLINAIAHIRTSLSKDRNYYLTCDIDLTDKYIEYCIDEYYGFFDGNGYRIINLELEDSSSNLAFIGKNYGTIRKLTIENATIRQIFDYETFANTAILVGENYGSISSCRVTGSVKSSCVNGNTAGLVAINDGRIMFSEAEVDLYAYIKNPIENGYTANIGGFVGIEKNATGGSKASATIKVVVENGSYGIYINRISVGLFAGTCDSYGGMYACKAEGSIDANMEKNNEDQVYSAIGGFIGQLTYGKLEECTADAKISSKLTMGRMSYQDSNGIGLFVGMQQSDTEIKNCTYATNESEMDPTGTSYGYINGLNSK